MMKLMNEFLLIIFLSVKNYEYHEDHGGHDWFFWNPELPRIFDFFGFKEVNEWNDSGLARSERR